MRWLLVGLILTTGCLGELEYELVVPEASRPGTGLQRDDLDSEALDVLLLIETDAECFRTAQSDVRKWAAAGNHMVATCAYPAAFSFKAFAAAAGLRSCEECNLERSLNHLRSLVGEFKVKMHELAPSMRLPVPIASIVRRYVLEEVEVITRAFQKLWSNEALHRWLQNPMEPLSCGTGVCTLGR